MISILEKAKLQDESRAIRLDEETYLRTGRNMAYDEYESSPLVPIAGSYSELENKTISNAQRAKIERIMAKQRVIAEKHRLECQNKIDKNAKIVSHPILSLHDDI